MRPFCLLLSVCIGLMTYSACCVATGPEDQGGGEAEDLEETPPPSLEWVVVPAGKYTAGRKDEIQTIGYDYEIMKYEVTNVQFVSFLNATVNADDLNDAKTIVRGSFGGDKYWEANDYQYLYMDRDGSRIHYIDGRFTVEAGYKAHPVVQVSWFGANAYAQHLGYRLPTKEEFEKAARGNTGWNYPWGDTIDGSRANFWNSGDAFDNGPTPVGTYTGGLRGGVHTTDSPSPYGAYDLVGNVAEWTNSYWIETTRTHELYRIVSGGSCQAIKGEIQSWARKDLTPWQGYPAVGFRCVRTD